MHDKDGPLRGWLRQDFRKPAQLSGPEFASDLSGDKAVERDDAQASDVREGAAPDARSTPTVCAVMIEVSRAQDLGKSAATVVIACAVHVRNAMLGRECSDLGQRELIRRRCAVISDIAAHNDQIEVADVATIAQEATQRTQRVDAILIESALSQVQIRQMQNPLAGIRYWRTHLLRHGPALLLIVSGVPTAIRFSDRNDLTSVWRTYRGAISDLLCDAMHSSVRD